ncbi:hypothetical protein ACJJTC_019162 [Scirpophaga incertulas]
MAAGRRLRMTAGKSTDTRRVKSMDHELCQACGREHAVETCKFATIPRVCNQEGHLKKRCPRLVDLADKFMETRSLSPSQEDDMEKRALRCRLDLLVPDAAVEQRVQQAKRKQAEKFIGRPLRQMDSGDAVWMQDFSGTNNWVAAVISGVRGPRNFMVVRGDGTTGQRHVDQLRERL